MRRKVLIADDNDMNRELLKHILHNEYDIIEARDGKEALELMEKSFESISAVLLDILMPRIDGYEVLLRMRSNEELAHIPVIVTTGNTDEGTEVKALALGATDYIEKPYNPDIISHRLWNMIDLREKAAIVNATKTDPLTGLYSRVAFFELASELITSHDPGYYVMTCFDIDNFKVINDQYGNNKGDEVLKQIAKIFKEGFSRVGGICCRIMADNYAVLYPKDYLKSTDLEKVFEKTVRLDGTLSPLSFSIGRYVVDDVTLAPSAMYDRAAMAKESIKGRFDKHIIYYDESMREEILKQQEIISEMNSALKSGQFEVWFQPQYNHATGKLVGSEALVRWRHPRKGLISPGVFIPIFEKNGFVYEVDKYVWEQTCIFIRKRLDEGKEPMPISVNISRYDVFSDDLIDVIRNLVIKYDIPVELLRLEITESAFALSSEHIIEVVNALKNIGFTMEIDDFGSGYSSLNTLKDVPADVVKLDMRFIEGEANSTRGGNILESVVRMTKWLGMTVLAEGVETKQQADYLKSIGCNYIQGYLYAWPMPEEEYEKLMDKLNEKVELDKVNIDNLLINDNFWNLNSIETFVFNNYIGPASVLEFYNGRIEFLRINDKFAETLGGIDMSTETALRVYWRKYISDENIQSIKDKLAETKEIGCEISDEIPVVNLKTVGKTVYIKYKMRLIATAGDRYLFYCTVEDNTELRMAQREIDSLKWQISRLLKEDYINEC